MSMLPDSRRVSGPPRAGLAARLKRWHGAFFRLVWSAMGLPSRLRVGGRGVGRVRAALEVGRHGMMDALVPTVTVEDAGERYSFRCAGHAEFVRVYTMLEREQGTVEWLRREVRPDDVVYDVGANIGAFTLVAARRIETGLVYAFEPHLANAASLIANLRENGVDGVVRVVSFPLSDHPGVFRFDYGDLSAGTALSQLGEPSRADDGARPSSPELKLATTVDELIAQEAIRPADLVKLDVDGQELEVLRGMRGLLTSPDRPRAVQSEVDPAERDELSDFMASCGFELAGRHHSAGAARLISGGADPQVVPFNAIFRPRAPG